jgi:hypothetical protein
MDWTPLHNAGASGAFLLPALLQLYREDEQSLSPITGEPTGRASSRRSHCVVDQGRKELLC